MGVSTNNPELQANAAPSSHINNLQQTPKVELTPSKLEALFARVEFNTPKSSPLKNESLLTSPTNESLSTLLISRFGLKSSIDIAAFLKSPEGKVITALIEKELAEIAELREERNYELREERSRHRFIAFLLLGLLYQRKLHAHHLNERLTEEMDKHLHEEKKLHPIPATRIEDYIQVYQEAISAIETKLTNHLIMAEDLEAEMSAIERLGEEINAKFTFFNQSIDAIEQEIEKELLKFGDTVDPHALFEGSKNTKDLEKSIEQKIITLAAQLGTQTQATVKPVHNFDYSKTRALSDNMMGLNLQMLHLKDLLTVIKGENVLYNINGERVKSCKEADFILGSSKKIVIHDGKYHLVPEGKTKEDLRLNEAFRAQSHQSYLALKPKITLRRSVEKNHRSENSALNEKQESLVMRSKAMQRDILVLANQLTQLQAAHSQAKTELEQTQLSPALKPKMSVSTSSSQLTPIPNTSKPLCSQTYKHVLCLMQGLEKFKAPDKQPEFRAGDLRALTSLQSGQPIPFQAMQSLLRNIERFGVDATKPSVTATINPLEREANLKSELPQFAPTPFSTKPYLGG